jgi:flavodoxin
MKTAVIFYSYDGNCAFAAEQIGALLKADLVQIQTVDQKKRRGFLKILWGGMQVMTGKLPALKPVNFDAAAFDLIILGAPVWASSPPPAMKAFLSQTKICGKKLALFMCHKGGKGNAVDKFKALLKDNDVISEADFIEPQKNTEKARQQIEEWVKKLTP